MIAVGTTVLVALVAVSCGDDPDAVDTASPATVDEGGGSADTATLCGLWAAVYQGEQEEGLDSRFLDELGRVAPSTMTDDIERFIEINRLEDEADAAGQDLPEVEGDDLATISGMMGWVAAECTDGTLVAPPLAAVPAGLEVCAATAFPLEVLDDFGEGRAVIYAPGDGGDPFAGPVLMLTWGGTGGHRGDGDATPVTLRQAQGATDAVVAPITAFQQVVLPDLGSVVAWTEDGQSFGLYGRGWDLARSSELVALAEAIQRTGEGDTETYAIPAHVLPDGFTERLTGPAAAASPMAIGAYTVTFQAEGAAGSAGDPTTDPLAETTTLVTLSGSPSQPGSEELWRVFALESERIEVDGRTVSISEAAWSDDSPVVASWRTGDGHVSVFGIGVDREVVLELVAASRELTNEEWVELSSLTQMC